jgi:hypothetical protein
MRARTRTDLKARRRRARRDRQQILAIGGCKPRRTTRASQSTSIASLSRRHSHRRGRFQGRSATSSRAARSKRPSCARKCSLSCASTAERLCAASSSSHRGTTIRGLRIPSTAGPTPSDTATSTPSRAVTGHGRAAQPANATDRSASAAAARRADLICRRSTLRKPRACRAARTHGRNMRSDPTKRSPTELSSIIPLREARSQITGSPGIGQ